MGAGFVWRGDAVAQAVENEMKTELLQIAEDLKTRSVSEAPTETGALRMNCTVDSSEIDSGRVQVGYSLPYAMTQHEDLSLNYTQGKAKFLEDSFNENMGEYVQRLGAAAERGMKK